VIQDSEERERARSVSLQRHQRLARLFREDRLAFERERKRMIREFLESVKDPELREKLWALQRSWDKRMKGAGSEHNRFVLAQAFFWEHVQTQFLPALSRLDALVRQPLR